MQKKGNAPLKISIVENGMTKLNEKGGVMIFFTGGTISMTPRADGRGVVPSNNFDRLFVELKHTIKKVTLKPILWSNLPSPHMTPGHMFRLAKDLDNALAAASVRGVVVIHGTDVIVESAYMADLTMRSSKPVVFTGSMRFYSETGFDGIRNLLNGIKACILPLPPETGVVLLMTDRIFSAREVIKIHSMNIDAFEAPESGPVAYVAGDDVRLTRFLSATPAVKRPLIPTRRIEPNVAMISCYTGMDGTLVEHVLEHGIAGLVIEGFGAGNVPPGIVGSLEKAVRQNVPVVLTTHCPQGGVWPMYAYPGGGADLAKRGVILGGRLSGSKARIKLMVALGATRDMKKIKQIIERTA
jgi:L-asparaginase